MFKHCCDNVHNSRFTQNVYVIRRKRGNIDTQKELKKLERKKGNVSLKKINGTPRKGSYNP